MKNDSIDLICTHPPYADIIKYSDGIKGDISFLQQEDFLREMRKVAKESYRILKPNKICAYMIGDMRKNGNVQPLGFKSMNIFQEQGFMLKEIIIKEQHNCKGTRRWENKKLPFLLLAHEYIFILQK